MEAGLQQTPDEGELVLATVDQLTPHGVYVSLDEYGGLRGFLHISEIATGWVRHIERFAKPGQKIVLKVIRVSHTRREVDLSLRQVTGEEKRQKLIEVKKADKADGILDAARARLNLREDEVAKYASMLEEEFGTAYDGLEELAKKGRAALAKLELPEAFVAALEEIAREKIAIPTVKVRGTMELSSARPDGIDVIKQALSEAENVRSGGAKVVISYIGAPRYRVVVEAESYKVAERVLESATQRAQDAVVKKGGSFKFTREELRRRASE